MVSTRNSIPGKVKSMVSDKFVSEVIVETAAGDIASIITTVSLKAMKLKKGDKVSALVKATEAGIQKGRSPALATELILEKEAIFSRNLAPPLANCLSRLEGKSVPHPPP